MDGENGIKGVKRRKSLAYNVWFLVITAVILSSGLLFITSLYLAWSAIIVTTRQRMLDIANCAAGSVNGDILENITAEDKDTPEYRKIYDALAVYRDNVELEFVYGIKDEGDGRFTFTVDPAIKNPAEFGSEVIVTDALKTAGKGTSAVDENPYTDAWGSFYSAYSPVFDSKGNVAGIIAADFSVEWYNRQLMEQTRLAVAMYLAILVITLTGVGFLCFIRSRSITRPLKQITEIAGRYEKGDFSDRLEVEREDEIGALSRSLQAMATSLTEQVRKAEIASSAKSDFLAKMSHEIRTPINAILGMNEMIQRESDDTDILMYSENIKKAGGVLLSIINGILDLSKIEAGKMEIIPVGYDLSLLLDGIVNLIKIYADEKGLSFITDFDPDIPKMLKGDEVRIRQIITNILANAVKYTEKGSVIFTVGYEENRSEPDNIILKVSVKDTGVGIRPEDMDRLFSGFERLDEKRNRYIEGTGLGISITNSLLKMMGSSLHVESVFGKGSEFSFSLSQKALSREPLGDYRGSCSGEKDKITSVRERFIAPDANILAVDDNPMNLMVFKSLLKRVLVNVDMAESGDEGLKFLKIKHYDMIFLDHMMPGKDGIETLEEIRAGEKESGIRTPVICLTANAILGSRERYLEAGFDEYLSKPFDSDKLEEMIRKFLPEEKIKEPTAGIESERKVTDAVLPDKLKALDGTMLDVKNGVKNSGSVSYFLTLLKMFQKSAKSSTEALDHLLSRRDFKNYTVKVHALKSSAFIIGALSLGKDAQKLEEAGKSRNEEYLLNHHDRFTEGVLKLSESISGVFEEDEKGTKIPADDIVISEAYEKVRAAAEDMDYDRLESVIKGMSVYEMPGHEAETWERIVEAFEAYDYSAILALVKISNLAEYEDSERI